jgi:uncharacterized protein
MKLHFAIAASTFLLSSMAFSAVNLSLPEEIQLVAVNDQEVRTGLLRNSGSYKLDAGQNVLSVRYSEYFQHHDNSHDILRSGIVTIKTPNLQDGQQYKLALINPPKDFETAQEYKNQPVIGLYDAKNQLLVQQAGALGAAKPWFGGLSLTGEKTTDLTTGAKQQPAAQYVSAQPTTVTPSLQENPTPTLNLIQVWQNSSSAERQKFMSWLATQAQ